LDFQASRFGHRGLFFVKSEQSVTIGLFGGSHVIKVRTATSQGEVMSRAKFLRFPQNLRPINLRIYLIHPLGKTVLAVS
jgi:hypothetical protein